ncbi:MAG: hypothetical protein ACT4PY_09435 [Armatimonadota bacterium]
MTRLSVSPGATQRVLSGKRGEAGVALIVVLILLLTVAGASAGFIWFMNQQQTRAGGRLRAAAAMAIAEAGVYRALAVLESVTPDGRSPGRTWRPAAHTEPMTVGSLTGRFTLALADGPGGAIVITSAGEVAGGHRRVRARVYLASSALLAALHGDGIVRFEQRPAEAFLLPYGAGIGDRPWIHVAAGKEIWFATTAVSINDRSASAVVAPGPVDAPDAAPLRPEPVRLLTSRAGEVTLGPDHKRVDIQQLRNAGVHVEGVVLRTAAFPRSPDVDRTFFQRQASANIGNAALNEAAGRHHTDSELARKQDSLYSRAHFDKVQAFLRVGLAPPLFHGVVYVEGGVVLREGERMEVRDGAVITDSTIHIGHGAALQVTHTAPTRTLPGIIVLDNGGITVTQGARLRAHGLVYTSRLFDVGQGGHVDVVGAVLSGDPDLSFRNFAATVVIRYDPAVLGTPGLRVSSPTDGQPAEVAWVAAWEELP